MNLRYLSAACAALLTTAAYAQTAGGPPIAYVKRVSNGDEIYLVNPDNTGLIRVYKAPSKVQVTMLDLRPGGGEVAFLENFAKLKILAFDSYGRAEPGNPRTISTVSSPCTVESPDYHPTDGRLLFVQGCGRDRAVRTVQPGANSADALPLFGSVAVFRARWSRLGDTIYYIGLRDGALSSDPTYLYRRSSAPSGTPEEIGVLNSWSTFDVAREGEKLFWGNDNFSFKVLDLAGEGASTSNATTLQCPRGLRMAFGPGDTRFVYTTESTKGGHFVIVGPSNCGSTNSLTGKGSWGWLDWRSQ
jgi:hypothetical protein